MAKIVSKTKVFDISAIRFVYSVRQYLLNRFYMFKKLKKDSNKGVGKVSAYTATRNVEETGVAIAGVYTGDIWPLLVERSLYNSRLHLLVPLVAEIVQAISSRWRRDALLFLYTPGGQLENGHRIR